MIKHVIKQVYIINIICSENAEKNSGLRVLFGFGVCSGDPSALNYPIDIWENVNIPSRHHAYYPIGISVIKRTPSIGACMVYQIPIALYGVVWYIAGMVVPIALPHAPQR